MVTDHPTAGQAQGTGRGSSRAALPDLRCLRVPAAADHLPTLRRELSRWAARTGLGDDEVEALALATYEAMANVVEHAYSEGVGGLDLEAVCLPEENRVQVTVSDQGEWLAPSEPSPYRGRGLELIRRLAQETDVTTGDEGTAVRMSWSMAG